VFAALAVMVAGELQDRREGDMPAAWLMVTAKLDETAFREAHKDDLVSTLAWALAIADRPETRPGTP
jgi:hypothetical protein